MSKEMKLRGFLIALLSLNLIILAIASSQTCPADISAKCSDGSSYGWEGEFFAGISKIKYEGPNSKNWLSYKWYIADEEILVKKIKLRFSIAFWHTFRGTGADPFGAPTKTWPWKDATNSVEMAKRRSNPLSWRRKLCLLGWPRRVPDSFKH